MTAKTLRRQRRFRGTARTALSWAAGTALALNAIHALAWQNAPLPVAAPASFEVERGPLKVEIAASGVFEAEQMTEVILRPQAWTELSVVDAVPQGTAVRAGDRLVELDTRKIDEAIRDLESGQRLADLAVEQAE